MKYFSHPAAKEELVEAVNYYNVAVMHLSRKPNYWEGRLSTSIGHNGQAPDILSS